jgi:hypothetical protein
MAAKPGDIIKAFSKYAGREVPMTEIEVSASPLTSGFTIAEPADRHDAVLREMRDEAKAMGFKLFVAWPGHSTPLHAPFAPVKHRDDRINARIEKGADGKWRVSGEFRIG